MQLASHRRPVVALTGAFLTLLVGAAVAPSQARAGCGHYVVSEFERARSVSTDLRILGEPPGDHSGRAPAPAERRERPCSGPSCSEGPQRPEAPTVTATPAGDRWCDTTATARVADPAAGGALEDGPSPRPLIRPTSLERPPRAVPPLHPF